MSSEEELRAKYLFGLKPTAAVQDSHGSRRAATQCQYMLPTLEHMVGENKSLKILDVGCGPGSITVDFATMVPEGEVVGFDLSAAVLETAASNASAAGVQNVKFVQGDVYALPFADGTFDLVHTHQAVCHFHEQVRAIKELKRVTKKGGAICMREADITSLRFYPDSIDSILSECFETMAKVHTANGGVPDAARYLKAWTVAAGIPRENIVATHSCWSHNTAEQRAEHGRPWPSRCTEGAFAESAIAMGTTKARLEEYAQAWRDWIEQPDALLYMVHGEVIARV